jgi:hypothetical protein
MTGYGSAIGALAETARMLDGTSPLSQWRAKVFEEIEDVVRRTGRAERTEDPMPHTVSDVLVVLKPTRTRGLEEIEVDMREQLEGLPGIAVLFTTPLGMRIDEGLGGTPADSPDQISGKASRDSAKSIIDADARDQKAFIDRWTPRLDTVTNARHKKLLHLILGEMKEHLRVLEQAAEGRADLLGRHSDGKVLRGSVMAARPKN